jgi:vacuolar protein-sorting-associated protein 4
LTPANYRVLGELSEGYTRNDISAIVQDALLQPVRELSSATHFKKAIVSFSPLHPFHPYSCPPSPFSHKAQVISDGRDLFIPCSPGSHGAIEMNATDADSENLLARPVRHGDFVRAVGESRRTVSMEDIERFDKWTLTVW